MKNLTKSQYGFTLIEIMVVVVILGILAGIVVPRLLDEPEKARRTTAATQIRSFEEALGIFKLDNGFFPSTEQGLQALVEKPTIGRIPGRFKEGGYIKKIPLDPWGQPYLYLAPGAHGDYDLFSYGPDGESGGEGDDADIANWNLD
ncbi:MAG: type II secretion system major pseudopilin GspG [Desulfuromonadales bacterium]|nr:type II secretion system major pseudopilin GspG [Desulfuromonadales bacterium]MBN2790984.1 type II secretion system major pseudopilin GspG [Desulfuromonadales bacterium]